MSLEFQHKQVWISAHAIRRARSRHVVFPDMVYATIRGGHVERFGKNCIKFSKRYKNGRLICVGEDLGYEIVIKTIEWGN